jgi:hypothetical protein
VALKRHVDIVDIAAAAGDEAGILEPGNRLADTEFGQALSPQVRLERRVSRVSVGARAIVEPDPPYTHDRRE